MYVNQVIVFSSVVYARFECFPFAPPRGRPFDGGLQFLYESFKYVWITSFRIISTRVHIKFHFMFALKWDYVARLSCFL